MIYMINHNTEPFFNMAVEEYLLNSPQYPDDIFMLWQNDCTIVVGRHQNTNEEINNDFVKKKGLKVVRRLSGGGAVFHDMGNLNFTFIRRNSDMGTTHFGFYVQPVIATLGRFGIKAEFSGRNDITVNGQKFSGNAQYFSSMGLLHHGTLLFNSDFATLAGALNPNSHKYESKGVKSVRSRVVNIKECTDIDIDFEEFKMTLIETVFSYMGQDYEERKFDSADNGRIQELADSRYGTWEWNYGSSPNYNFKQEKSFAGGTVSTCLDIDKGIIKSCRFYGDFFTYREISEVTEALVGITYDKESIRKVLKEVHADNYFSNISIEELLECLTE